MCKESMAAGSCPGCGQRLYYAEQHIPHCVNPVKARDGALIKSKKKEEK